jgi:hypothetical protein
MDTIQRGESSFADTAMTAFPNAPFARQGSRNLNKVLQAGGLNGGF